MKRTDAPGHVGNLFTDGDPVGGIPATMLESTIMNAIQEEICTVIEGAGDTLDPADNTQLLTAIQTLIAAVATGFASNAEAWAGVLSNKALVPSNFKNSFAANDYIRLPGGLVLQWGQAATISGSVTVVWPVAFTTFLLGGAFDIANGATAGATNMIAIDPSANATGGTFWAIMNSGAVVNSPFFYFALGKIV